ELGDSNLPHAPVAGGSNSTASITEAIVMAAAAARANLARLAGAAGASPPFGLTGNEDTLRDGPLVAAGEPSRGETVGTILHRAGVAVLDGEAAAQLSAEKAQNFAFQSFGAQFCEVKVDEWLGRVRVTRWVGAYDPGRVLNPKTARSQVLGGV